MRVFVNDRPVEVIDGATAQDAVAALDPGLAEGLADGLVVATDGVGRAADLGAPLTSGAILRVRARARRAGDEE
jgi:hypothetical protein